MASVNANQSQFSRRTERALFSYELKFVVTSSVAMPRRSSQSSQSEPCVQFKPPLWHRSDFEEDIRCFTASLSLNQPFDQYIISVKSISCVSSNRRLCVGCCCEGSSGRRPDNFHLITKACDLRSGRDGASDGCQPPASSSASFFGDKTMRCSCREEDR